MHTRFVVQPGADLYCGVVGDRLVYSTKVVQFGAQLKERYHESLASVSPSELVPSPTSDWL